MAGKQAKVLAADIVKDLLVFASCTRQPIRNRVIVLLSVKAGLRAAEIAKVTWDMVLLPNGSVGHLIELRNHAAKKGSGRRIPVHPDLHAALTEWHSVTQPTGAIIKSERNASMHPASIVNWFASAYVTIGLKGCSSHSGRRTFITRAARLLPRTGGSLRDVQLLAGHRSIQTTQGYIDGDSDAQRKLVALL